MSVEPFARRSRASKIRLFAAIAIATAVAAAVTMFADEPPSENDVDAPRTTSRHAAGNGMRAKGQDGATDGKRYAVGGPAPAEERARPKNKEIRGLEGYGMIGLLAPGGGGLGGPQRFATGTGQGFGGGGLAPRRGNQQPRSVRRDFLYDREGYAPVSENPFLRVVEEPRSTFSVDVDTASYANARRMLREGALPRKDSIRVEEWINYFSYAYPAAPESAPFSVHAEVSESPFDPKHRLVRIGLQGRSIATENRPAANLVFLLDVSGSMASPDKLPLLQRAFALLTDTLREDDRVAIAVYAGASGLVLPPTSGADRGRIRDAIGRLQAGGSTNGAQGIQLAYDIAERERIAGGINRVILATDGDFNVGVSSDGELSRLIERKRRSGVFLTVLGFGRGNLQDAKMELLADRGNGQYAYVDSLVEARKVLLRQVGGTLVTIAKDVKIQVELNPKHTESYRLIGYENRLLANRDFADDAKDAGEIGAGHSVTALYEVVPKGHPSPDAVAVDALKYQTARAESAAADSAELMTVRIRYKAPNAKTSTKVEHVVPSDAVPLAKASQDHRFAVAVASAALVLRGAPHLGPMDLSKARELAAGALGADPDAERRELVSLLETASTLSGKVAGMP